MNTGVLGTRGGITIFDISGLFSACAAKGNENCNANTTAIPAVSMRFASMKPNGGRRFIKNYSGEKSDGISFNPVVSCICFCCASRAA